MIRILLTKLQKKKGQINKKSIHVRRNIVYSFLSNLDPQQELVLVFNELFSEFGITLQKDLEMKETIQQFE